MQRLAIAALRGVTGALMKGNRDDCAGTRSFPPHGFCRGTAEAARVHHRRAPAARDAGQSLGCRSAEGLRRRPRRAARRAHRFHQRAHAAAVAAFGRRHAAHAGIPARHPARDPARAVVGQEGSHRRQRAGRDLRREGIARRLFPEPARRHAPRRRQLHRARHHQESAGEAGEGRGQGRRRRRERDAGRARFVHRQPEHDGEAGQDRSADRPRARARARDPGAVPPAQEQSAAGRRGRRGQDRDRRRARAADQRARSARAAARIPGLLARHGRAARRHQVPRRFRAAPEGGAEAARRKSEVDPVHRRDPHDHRRGRRVRRHARRVEPAEAGAVDRRAEVHRRHDLRRVPADLREGPRAVAALPEGRRAGAVDRRDHRDPQGSRSRASSSTTASSTRRRRSRRRPSSRRASSTTAICRTRRST